jgi:amino acid adenylation domain-containing protein
MTIVEPEPIGLPELLERPRIDIDPDVLQHLTPLDQRRFRTFGVGRVQPPPFSFIHEAFEYWAQVQPDAPAVHHEGSTITYHELDQHSTALAAALVGLGVDPGDAVALYVRRGIPMVVGMLAALKAGACYVPQDAAISPASTLEHVTKVSNAKVVLTLADHHAELPHSGLPTIEIDRFMAEPLVGTHDERSRHLVGLRSPDDRCFILFTSGTTGQPNGVQVTHRNICNILLTDPGNLGMGPGTTVAQILNIAFDMAAWETLGALMNGAHLLIRGSGRAGIQEVAERADVLIATPSILGSIDAERCQQVVTAAVAGEPCPQPLADTWSSFSRFYNSCGPTETTIINTAHQYRPEIGGLNIGGPTPNNTVYVLDENLHPLPIGEVGEMWAGGDCVTSGYVGNPELTAERYRPDPFLGGSAMMFRTRDLGAWTETGELAHHGRTDDQVKVRGFRVELGSVSTVLESVEGCTAAATLKYDARNLVAYVQPATVDPDECRAALAEALPYYCQPTFIEPVDALPRTDRGKIDKRLLLEWAETRGIEEPAPEADAGAQEPKQPTELIELLDPAGYDRVTLPKQLPLYRRMWKSRHLMHYNRLVALTVLVNLIVLWRGIAADWWTSESINVGAIGTVTIANLSAAILIRQQYVINLLFRIGTAMPTHWPLRLRAIGGKVYHFGGIHVGGSVMGTLWFGVLAGSILWGQANGSTELSGPTVALTIALVALLVAIIIFALPPLRAKYHDNFEKVHRFGGWTSLALFWIHTLVFNRDVNGSLVSSVSFWLLIAVTISIILPWTRLRKVPVEIVRPSNHVALARFDYGVTPFAGSATTLSRNPLTEWHSFANVPQPGREGYRLTISRAGDWTGSFIDDAPDHIWVKGIPTAGVGNIDKLFKKVVWIATGSGIGPTLPHLLAETAPAHLVWATRDPRATYGDELVDEILEKQPNATIWDTTANGKPDMVKLAYWAVLATGAEAVITISNKSLTWQVVEGMERIGVPAYGAIWDS